MCRRGILGQLMAVLVSVVFISACGSAARVQPPTSGSPTLKASVSPGWVAVVNLGGYLDSHSFVNIRVTGGVVRFIVTTATVPGSGATAATFHSQLFELPQFTGGNVTRPFREVPVQVATKTEHGYKTYDVRSSKPVTPGQYQLTYSGVGLYKMGVYVLGAS